MGAEEILCSLPEPLARPTWFCAVLCGLAVGIGLVDVDLLQEVTAFPPLPFLTR